MKNFKLISNLACVFLLFFAIQSQAQNKDMKPIKRIIKVNATQQIETFVYGNGSVALIMASGNGRPGVQMEGMAQAIAAKGIKVITYNYRTIGASTGKIDNLTLHDYGNDILEIVKGLGLKKVFLAGKTYGNRVVRVASEDHPDMFAGVILIGAGGQVMPSEETIKKAQRQMDPSISKEEWLKLQGELDYAPGNEHLAKSDMNEGTYPELAKAQADASQRTPNSEWEMGGTAPMLIITCFYDLYAPPESGLILAKKRPKSWYVGLPNCGHNMVNERGDDIKKLIVEFIKNTPSDKVKSAKID